MLIIGLTGSIGMGKTTAANDFSRLGIPVHNADRVVHGLLGFRGNAVSAVASAFPGVEENGFINREKLGNAVFGSVAHLKKLEQILHPMVLKNRKEFLLQTSRRGTRIVVLDVPMLFETGGNVNCDAVVTVSAPDFVQLHRVLSRPGMDRVRFYQVLSHQISDAEKRRRSNFVIQTGLGRQESLRNVRRIIKEVSSWAPKRWPPWIAGRASLKKGKQL